MGVSVDKEWAEEQARERALDEPVVSDEELDAELAAYPPEVRQMHSRPILRGSRLRDKKGKLDPVFMTRVVDTREHREAEVAAAKAHLDEVLTLCEVVDFKAAEVVEGPVPVLPKRKRIDEAAKKRAAAAAARFRQVNEGEARARLAEYEAALKALG